MIKKKNSAFSSFFWKISLLFMFLLVVLGGVYIWVISNSANHFYLQTKQSLCKNVAKQVIDDVEIFKDGKLNEEAIKHIMMHHMSVNPSAEVYVLDTLGKILTYDAPPEKIKLKLVSLLPIKQFIAQKGDLYIDGNDPRNIGVDKIFSAAPILKNNQLQGYVYVILASEEFQNASDLLFNNYIFDISLKLLLVALLMALIIGWIMIRNLTKCLRSIEQGVHRFNEDDFSTTITVNAKGEFKKLADILNKMANTIRENIQQIKSVENLRKELIANVSHDLRTPLAIIHGYAETIVIKGQNLSEEERMKYVNNILKSSENLEKLVAELFELSKLESNKIILKREKINLAELFNDIVGRYQILAQQKNIQFSLDVQVHSSVNIDIALFERVIQNLIENALKFTPEGGKIEIQLIQEEKSIFVKIKDTGIGIEKEKLPFVFERYQKSNKEFTSNPGAGLGLAIVKKILELHAINIQVASTLNEGTSFSFHVPME